MGSNLKNILRIVLGLAFLGAGVLKFVHVPSMTEVFADLNYPPWFMYFTGILEFFGGLLVLTPRTVYLGTGLIAVVMIGAAGSLIFHPIPREGPLLAGALVMLILAIIVGMLHRNRLEAQKS